MLVNIILAGFFTFVELNCENLFDCIDDTLTQDEEFLPEGSHKWSRTRYWRKLNAIGKEIVACGMADPAMAGTWQAGANISWQLPDMVALCEVESDSCLFDLTRRSLLRSARYEYVMTRSPDVRGVNVALLWSPFSFRLLTSHSLRVPPPRGLRPTRDVLYASGLVATGDTLHVFVVHAPSKQGGNPEADRYRMCVSDRICESVDSIRRLQPSAHILVAGDLNAYTREKSMQRLVAAQLTDVTAQARGNHGAKGTYRYRGEWGSLDHILLSEETNKLFHDCFIMDAPFLMEPDEKYGGMKPWRTYMGPRYIGGFSDHLPLVVRLSF
ncbi:MAG: endonuclease [Prevotella sp.]|nr:endonuclease [Prevotella sp.]